MRIAWLVFYLLFAGCAAKKQPVTATPPPIRSQLPPATATLRNSQAGKCQHGNLQLSARDHFYRFQDGAHQASLQENGSGKMNGTGANPISARSLSAIL